MTDKELRKLKRAELLEILYYLQKESDRLKQENLELKQRLENGSALPENFMQQIEQTVQKAVKGYFGQQTDSADKESDVRIENTGDEK